MLGGPGPRYEALDLRSPLIRKVTGHNAIASRTGATARPRLAPTMTETYEATGYLLLSTHRCRVSFVTGVRRVGRTRTITAFLATSASSLSGAQRAAFKDEEKVLIRRFWLLPRETPF